VDSIEWCDDGAVHSASRSPDRRLLRVKLQASRGANSGHLDVTHVVLAHGFDPWTTMGIVYDPGGWSQASIRHFLGSDGCEGCRSCQERFELGIRYDLSSPDFPGLHLPGLSVLAQGPSLGSLGALGDVAARIVDPYVGLHAAA
jgi:hypothetical protein